MNIYVNVNLNGAVEDLVNTLEELKPGMVSSRMVLEISTEDRGLAALLKKLAEDMPDEVNAAETRAKPGPHKTKRGKSISLKSVGRTPSTPTGEDGGEL